MRKNVAAVYTAWKEGRVKDMGSIVTNGESIMSYTTCLVHPTGNDGEVVFNNTRYSVTTSQQQGALRYALERDGFRVVLVEDIRRNAWPGELVDAYEAALGVNDPLALVGAPHYERGFIRRHLRSWLNVNVRNGTKDAAYTAISEQLLAMSGPEQVEALELGWPTLYAQYAGTGAAEHAAR